ncbi:MAG TPA: 1-deoxy-D-xylulose-5-phosphate synthase [Candidatus Ratteibacteria bacterium]|nr:1-deoxy-D-xylulose-5-phosphate synthase [bacterium]HPC28947.1 1-deoxy-D-xylulose-5-phosphate synthase [bacterium]HRS05607.1 1-deoxy-D-xylulose-5-phosphate synthase [Candidatus Ratteibacteria bacterium]HRV03730.1 1-deoxy-D-xylulose-5-phosphate synthase [Candidatus Ratteibacteria bacterium]
MKTILEEIDESPKNLKNLTRAQLEQLAAEIRKTIIEVVSKNGGHLASNLGIVEITIVLHYILNIPPDKIIFDVGHQVYTHKLLTGRYKLFNTLRKYKGISGFPNSEESETDIFTTGHAGTAVSAGIGIQTVEQERKNGAKTVVVIGDGSLTNGITFEGLNNLGTSKKNLLIILNDNNFSISKTRGSVSYYLTRLITMPVLAKSRDEIKEIIEKIPGGEQILKVSKDIEQKTKYLVIPGGFFEKLGIQYFGPIDGNDIHHLIDVIKNIIDKEGPIILHTITQKGKGYKPAEENPEKFHSIGTFNINPGYPLSTIKTTGSFVGEFLEQAGEKNDFYVITSAMEYGLGFDGFAKKFPERFFDVGIAESHSLIFASGIVKAGKRVFVGIYSTFLQRTYDQIFHDICLQKLPVVILVDRAGIVSGDGPTHQGIYDISFLRSIPEISVFSPYSLENLNNIMKIALQSKKPMVIRYPKELLPEKLDEIRQNGRFLCIGLGSIAQVAKQACLLLNQEGINLDFLPEDHVKPIDDKIKKILSEYDKVITCEEAILPGGFGTSILEFCNENNIQCKILRIGISDTFIETGSREEILESLELDVIGIMKKIRSFCEDA